MPARKKYLILILILFGLTRLFYFFLGVRFQNLDHTVYFLQVIDSHLLRNDFLSSIYYTSFPPFFNVILGIVLKLFPDPNWPLNLFYLFLGVVLSASMFYLMSEIMVPPRLGFWTTAFFITAPPAILYENMPFYTYLIVTLTCLTGLFFARFLKHFRIRDGILLFSCYTCLALTNALFFYLLIVILACLIFHSFRAPSARRKMPIKKMAVSCIPVILVFAVCIKNFHYFGKFSVDAHFGFHMGNGLFLSSRADKTLADAYKKKYPLFLKPAVSPMDDFKDMIGPVKKTAIPLLDNKLKSTGHLNHHSIYYIRISQLYSAAIRDFILHEPGLYLRFLSKSVINYLLPSHDFGLLSQNNRSAIKVIDNWYLHLYPMILLFFFFAVIYTLGDISRSCAPLRHRTGNQVRTPGRQADQTAILAFLVAFIFFNMLAVFLTFGENNRYKFSSEPLLYTLLAWSFHEVFQRIKGNKGLGVME